MPPRCERPGSDRSHPSQNIPPDPRRSPLKRRLPALSALLRVSGCSSLFFPVVSLRFFVSLDPNAEPEAKQHRYQGGRHRGLLRETLELGITDDRGQIPAQLRLPVLYLRAQVRDLPSPAMARADCAGDSATFVAAQCAVPAKRH